MIPNQKCRECRVYRSFNANQGAHVFWLRRTFLGEAGISRLCCFAACQVLQKHSFCACNLPHLNAQAAQALVDGGPHTVATQPCLEMWHQKWLTERSNGV